MEEISVYSKILEIVQLGLAGVFLAIFIFVIKYLYSELKTLQTAFREYLQVSNEKLFSIVDKNTSAYDNMTKSFDKNTLINEKFATMVEKKLDIIDMLKKTAK